MRTYSVAAAPKVDSSRWPQRDPMTWAQLVAWLDLDNPADVKDCGGYVLGVLANKRRAKDTVISRSALALDADAASVSFVADSATELGTAAVIHTTWRHSPENPRYRLLVPLSRDVTPAEYRLLARGVIDALGPEQFDVGSSLQPERVMFRPSSQGRYARHLIDGDPLDVDAWLGRSELHPYAARAVEAELTRLDECQRLGWHGKPWNNTTYAVACNLIELANAKWAGYDLDQARTDLFARAPTDEGFGPAEHAGRWESALAKIGDSARPHPVGIPTDDFAPVDEPVPTGPAAAFPRMDFGALLDPNRPPREWVVEPMLGAGSSVALVAPAGHRKSLLLFRIALAVARGENDFAGMAIPRARRVFYVDMELTEDDVADRLASFGVTADELMELSRLIYVHLPALEPLDTAAGGERLAGAVDAYGLEPGDLVVLDSYQRVTEAGENDSDTTRGYYRHTGVRLKARGLTVVRTDNTGKDVAKGARGSSGKRDDVDVEYLLESKSDYMEIRTGKVRQRGITELSLYVATDAEGRTTFSSDLSPERTKIEECVALLEELGVGLESGERRVTAILKKAERQVPRAVLRVAIQARRDRAEMGRRGGSDEGADGGALY